MLLNWEIWLDCQISPVIAKWLQEKTGWVVKSSYVLSLHNLKDEEIYLLAKKAGNVIFISKDIDFSTLISKYGAPPKLINLQVGNCDNRQLWNIIDRKIEDCIHSLVNDEINIIELEP